MAENWPEAPPNTLVCLLCRGVVPCGLETTDKYLGHLRNDHNAYFHLDLLLKINMLDRSVVEMLCKAEVTNPKLAPLQAKIKEEPQQQQILTEAFKPQSTPSSQPGDQTRPPTPSYPRPTTPSYIQPAAPAYAKPPTPNYSAPPKAPSPDQFAPPTLTEEPVYTPSNYTENSNYENYEANALKNQSVSLRSANIKVSGIAGNDNDEDDDEDMSEQLMTADEGADDVDKILEGFRARLKGFPADQIAESMGIDGTKKANFACYECGQSFALAVELKLHKLSHAGSKGQIKCDICQEEFKQRSAMDQHKRTVHTEDRPYQCPVCPKNYAKSAELKLHNFAHTGETPFSCDLCPATFNRPANLRRHKINHQRNNSLSGKRSSIFSCDICTLRFPDALALKCHTEVHGIGETSQTAIIICKVCAKTFSSPATLKEHMMTHSGAPSSYQSIPSPIPTNPSPIPTPEHVACDVCSARFLRQDQLTRHKSMEHNTQTPQTCKECGKTFSRTKALQMHTYLHTGDTNFNCTSCPETFTHSVTFASHFERAHGEPAPSFYNCAKCGVTFTKSQSRDKHQNLDLCPKY